MRFGSSSTEMVQAALRMARAATGRARVLRFHGHYHGWIDNIYARNEGTEAVPASKGQLASALSEVITIEWNDAEAFGRVIADHGDEIAAVIMEPVMLNAGVIVPEPNYLETVRRICQQQGIVLIFDETISGFRLALGGAAERYGVYPDLAVYGKAMAAGWPCAALAGRRDLFADVATGAVTHAGTFNGNTVATAAVLASLDELASGEVYERVSQVGTALMESIRSCAAASQLEPAPPGPAHGLSRQLRRVQRADHQVRPSFSAATRAATGASRAPSSARESGWPVAESGTCQPPTQKPTSPRRSTGSSLLSRYSDSSRAERAERGHEIGVGRDKRYPVSAATAEGAQLPARHVRVSHDRQAIHPPAGSAAAKAAADPVRCRNSASSAAISSTAT